VKVSVSLPDDDIEFVDQYAARAGIASRSAVIHQAIGLLRSASLEDAYAAAWSEWEASGDATLWNATVADGIVDAER
jgi:Arc/MetJ-type ribon-helix-helix transcriptional regulator